MSNTLPSASDHAAAYGRRSQATLRLGVVDYLNMQPLIAGLDEAFGERLDLHHGTPSDLARWLEEERIDVGMVPVGALFAHPEWEIVKPDGGDDGGVGSMIGSRGAVRSVLVMGNGTPDRWRRLRPDSHSVTSNVLARIILEKKLRLKLEIGEPIPPDGWEPPEGGAVGEAFVLIGSRALRWRDWASATGREATALDLGREWWDWTGLPAVFAVWVARPGVELGDWPRLLEEHKRRNRDRLDAIAAAWPGLEHNRMTAADARDYMTNVIEYDLDGAALEGLARFRREAGAFL